ncbi:hypothetical protein [Streptomyces cellulosae]|uniref:Uncharacterized protein n=1 Tax=Streptomyces cellulosae TaxID=1968 RepID=A0ABW7YD55_STRCE
MSLSGLATRRTQCLAHDIRGSRVSSPGSFVLTLGSLAAGLHRTLATVRHLLVGALRPGMRLGGGSLRAGALLQVRLHIRTHTAPSGKRLP